MKKSYPIAIIAIVIVAIVVAVILFHGGVVQKPRGDPKEGLIIEVLELVIVDVVKVRMAQSDGFTSYGLYYRDNGYVYLVGLRVSNKAKETCGIAYRLATDKGQYEMIHSCTIDTFVPGLPEQDPKYQELFNKAVEVDKLYVVQNVFDAALSPEATQEYYVPFCIPRGEIPRKIHIVVRTLGGEVIEFDAYLPTWNR